jgi:hypothetical protein
VVYILQLLARLKTTNKSEVQKLKKGIIDLLGGEITLSGKILKMKKCIDVFVIEMTGYYIRFTIKKHLFITI